MSRLNDLGFSVRSIDVLGVRVDDVTLREALAICHACIRSGKPHRVVTPNAEFVMAARPDPGFRQLLNDSTLLIPDGAGLLLAGRLLGARLHAQVAGTDLADQLAGLCAREGYRLFLLGAAPGVADEAGRRLRARHPNLIVAGTCAGSADPSADDETRARLRAAGRIDVLLVAFGAPKQEAWIERNQAALEIPLAIGVGGALDFLSGRVPRAPAAMRRLGFDWLFRLTVQPWRWRRQLALPRFVVAVTYEGMRRRLAPGTQ
ncbi:MAG TPA: WecB/TagA/CpsF family glycosyltransferase [Chloroflexota bacterium]|nr:WecB/TagA/CpsF family glycosyltransferase [Chloroflexota bacterium]